MKPHLMSKDFMLVSKALGVSYKLVAEHLNGSLVGVGGHESATTHRREGREIEGRSRGICPPQFSVG